MCLQQNPNVLAKEFFLNQDFLAGRVTGLLCLLATFGFGFLFSTVELRKSAGCLL